MNVLVFSHPTSVNTRAELVLGGATTYGHGHCEWGPPNDPGLDDVARRMAVGLALHDLADTVAFAARNDVAGSSAGAHLAHLPPTDLE